MADLNMAHPQLFPSLCESVWTIRKNIFCSRFPSCTPATTFHGSLLQFSPICGRTWCLHIAPLCCDTQPYLLRCEVWLWSAGRSLFTLVNTCSPCCVSILPMSLNNRAHAPSCHSDMMPFTKLFRHTLYNWRLWILFWKTVVVCGNYVFFNSIINGGAPIRYLNVTIQKQSHTLDCCQV